MKINAIPIAKRICGVKFSLPSGLTEEPEILSLSSLFISENCLDSYLPSYSGKVDDDLFLYTLSNENQGLKMETAHFYLAFTVSDDPILDFPHPLVKSLFSQQLLVGAAFCDLPMIQDEYLVHLI